jgi:hypothetical protein
MSQYGNRLAPFPCALGIMEYWNGRLRHSSLSGLCSRYYGQIGIMGQANRTHWIRFKGVPPLI